VNNTTYAIISEGNPATILARIQDQFGVPISQSQVTSISVAVWNVETSTLIATTTPSVSSCVFDSFQTDGRWSIDAIGYNFAANIDGTSFNVGDNVFQIQATITPITGDPYVITARVQTRPVFS
jgi:hypothetical protein